MGIVEDLDERRGGERVPPQDRAAEQAVLGGMLLSTDASIGCLGMLRAADFYQPRHELIFEAIRALVTRGEPADAITVSEELTRQGQLEKAGGIAYPHQLTAMTPTAANATYYADVVRGKAILRRLGEVGTRMVQASFATEGEPSELVAAAREDLDRVLVEAAKPLRFVRDVIPDLVDRLKANETFTPTPWAAVNRAIGGFRPGAVYVIAARPGEGKTMLALQAALEMSKYGLVSFSSLEMSDTELVSRLLADRLDIYVGKLKDNRLEERDWEKINGRRPELNGIGLVIDDATQVSAVDVRAHAAKVRRQGPLAAVFVDYLQLMSSGSKLDRHLQVAEFSRQLKILAKDLQVPVIALSQLNRESEKRAGKRPQLSDLRESGAIEQDADVVILLSRRPSTDCENPDHTEYGDRHDGLRVPVDELIADVAKNRHGNTGECHLRWEGEFSRATDWERTR